MGTGRGWLSRQLCRVPSVGSPCTRSTAGKEGVARLSWQRRLLSPASHCAPWWRGGPGGICAGSCRWWGAGVRAVQPPGQVGGDGSTDLPVPLTGLGAGGDRLAWMWPGGPSCWRDAAAYIASGQAPLELPGACWGWGASRPSADPGLQWPWPEPVPFPPCLMAHPCCQGAGRGLPRERMMGA